MFQQNYFDSPTKLFSDLYPAKFYPSAKSFVLCAIRKFVLQILNLKQLIY